MTSPLVNSIAEAWYATPIAWPRGDAAARDLAYAEVAADAVIAVVAALPADYTATDVVAFLRGDAGDPPEYEPEDEA